MYRSRFSPFEDLEAIRDQINQAFEPMVRSVVQDATNRTSSFAVPLELTESPTHYTLRASLPGIAPDKIDVQATGKTLSIAGEVLPPEATNPESGKQDLVHLKEFRYGKFRRTLEFENAIVSGEIKANYQHGILILEIPKEEAARNKPIKVDIKSE